eukprot:958541-Amphidinium_carterae.1
MSDHKIATESNKKGRDGHERPTPMGVDANNKNGARNIHARDLCHAKPRNRTLRKNRNTTMRHARHWSEVVPQQGGPEQQANSSLENAHQEAQCKLHQGESQYQAADISIKHKYLIHMLAQR